MGNKQTTSSYIPPPKKKDWKAYCVIDVGSVTCGYAYSFEDIGEIWMNKNWAELQGYHSYRAPSAILYNPGGEPQEFGFPAIDKYLSMGSGSGKNKFSYDGIMYSSNSEQDKYETDDDSTDTDSESEDASKRESAAANSKWYTDTLNDKAKEKSNMFQITADLALLVAKHCLNEIKMNYKSYRKSPNHILWVFVVPQDWPVQKKAKFRKIMKKKFTNEFKVGINFAVFNTTEALWFRLKELQYPKPSKSDRRGKKLQEGVIVVQAGGSRIETSLHVEHSTSKALEIKAQDVGGSSINKEFENQLTKQLGEEGKTFVTECQEKYFSIWLEFMLQFEIVKKSIEFKEASDIDIIISYGFAEAFHNIIKKPLKQILDANNRKNKIWITSSGKLHVHSSLAADIFCEIAPLLSKDVNDMCTKYKEVDVRAIVLAGGLAESKYLQQQLQEHFEYIPVIIPESSSMLLAEGALSMSKMKQTSHRIYGLCYYDPHVSTDEPPFSDERWKENVTGLNNGKDVIRKLLPFICVGDIIKTGKVYKRCFKHSLYTDNLCVQVYEIDQSKTVIDKMLAVQKRSLHKAYVFNNFSATHLIGELKMKLPEELQILEHDIEVCIYLDSQSFLTTMKVKHTEMNARKDSISCNYTRKA